MISGAKSRGGRLVGERICPEGFGGKDLFSTDNCYFVPPAANNFVVAYALRSHLDEFVLCSLIVLPIHDQVSAVVLLLIIVVNDPPSENPDL